MMYPGMVVFEMGWFDHLVAIVMCVFAPVLAYTSRQVTSEDMQLKPDEKIGLYHSNALLLFIFGLVVVTIWRLPGRTLESLGLDWPVWNSDVLLLSLAVILFYGLDLFFQYGLKQWREKTLKHRNQALTFIPTDYKELFHFIWLAFAAGICEELIFRGYLIHYISWWTGNTFSGILTACFFASALFAFLHGYQGYRSMIKIFFLAMLFSAIYVLSQSLVIVMVIHTIIDVLSGWFGIYILRHLKETESKDNISEH